MLKAAEFEEVLMGVPARNEPYCTIEEAETILRELNITPEQWSQVTGMGHRRGFECKADDTILNKFAAGALSKIGVCGCIFGSDSPQHHRGHNW